MLFYATKFVVICYTIVDNEYILFCYYKTCCCEHCYTCVPEHRTQRLSFLWVYAEYMPRNRIVGAQDLQMFNIAGSP